MSEAVFTILGMDGVVDLAEWRSRRDVLEAASGHGLDEQVDLDRLERAVDRVHALISERPDPQGKLVPAVETELLAIIGELTIDLVRDAAVRAERLAARLAAGRGLTRSGESP